MPSLIVNPTHPVLASGTGTAKKCLFTLTVLVTESLKAIEGRGLVGGEDHEADSKGCNLLAADNSL